MINGIFKMMNLEQIWSSELGRKLLDETGAMRRPLAVGILVVCLFRRG